MAIKLRNLVLTESKLDDKITSRAKITFGALVNAIKKIDPKEVDDDVIDELSDILGVRAQTLSKYIDVAKKQKFLNDDGTVTTKYAKEEPKGKVKTGGKISQALDSRIKKFKAPKVSSNNLFSEQIFKMLSLMKGQASQAGVRNSLLLTGDPGVGKTSFIRSFAKLVGLPLIPIEAPHITEEHIINIPFMIIRGNKVKKENAVIETAAPASLKNDGQQFDIVHAESNLVTKIKSMKHFKLDDQAHITSIAKDRNLRQIYLHYQSLIDSVRDSYHCILFLDEYYRNDNIKIRNILRNILNGRIGNDKIPKGTFIVYASNMNDEGLEEIPMNNDFAEMKFDAPDKEQWFKYILNKYEKNESKDSSKVKLDPAVFNKFYDTVKQSELSYEDSESEVRMSPRRWEQLLLFVNASLPVDNVKEAKILMSNFKVNFRNYLDGKMSDLFPKFQTMLVELIKETSGVDFDGEPVSEVDWKDTFQQQIEVKIKLDANVDHEKEVRKYVPVVSGEPGIGKTAHMRTVADNLDLHLIHIDVSNLSREATTGIPIASQATDTDSNPEFDKDGNPVMTTKFSKPMLLKEIERKMQEELDEDAMFPESERKKGQGKYKFLLLFDELTRADNQVFNAIRKLLLEKSFNEKYDLPDSILTVAALNPVDEGAEELTKHMRDVLDIIPARASWAKTESYLLSEERPYGLQEVMGFDLNAATVGALKMVLQQYQTRDEDWRGNPVVREERLFNLKDGPNIIYISPREVTDIVTMTNTKIIERLTEVGLVTTLSDESDDTIDDLDDDDFMAKALTQRKNKSSKQHEKEKVLFNLRTRYSEEDYEVFIKAMIVEFREAWASEISFICKKMDIDDANVLSVTTGFIMKNDAIHDQYEAIKTMIVEDVKSVSEMFDAYYDNPDDLYDSPHLDNYIVQNAPQKFVQEITDYIADKLSDIEQHTGNGVYRYINAEGEETEMSNTIHLKLELYIKYLKFMRGILKILSSKSEYAGKAEDAERTGQYLANISVSIDTISRDFMSTQNQNLFNYFRQPELIDPEILGTAKKLNREIRVLQSKFGLKKRPRDS